MREILLFSQDKDVIARWEGLIEAPTKEITSIGALQKALDASKIQIIMVDRQSIGIDIALIAKMCVNLPRCYIFVLNGLPSYAEGMALLQHAIAGYGNTYMSKLHLHDALELISHGNIWLYPEFVQQMIGHASRIAPKGEVTHPKLALLTPKELEIAKLVGEGMTNKEIATIQAITERTVKAHLTAIYTKLEVADRLSLALMIV